MATDESATPGDEAERWLPVRNYEGLFEVSNLGHVRSLDRTVPMWRGQRRVPGRILKPWTTQAGEPKVKLESGGRHTSRAVHMLVQEAFGIAPVPQLVPDAGELETWRPVVGYEGLYEVSDLGRVRSLHHWGGGKRGGLLRPAITGEYPRMCVALCKGGKHRTRLVHHLVLEAFVGPCPDGMEALHGPGRGLNNSLANLSWGTKNQNQGPDKVRDGTHTRGERAWKVKLTEAEVADCRRRYAAGESIAQIASVYGLSRQGMGSVIRGINWAWLPGAVEPERRGSRHRAKLTAEIVLECRARHAGGEDAETLASEFGVAKVTMQQAIVGRTWKNL